VLGVAVIIAILILVPDAPERGLRLHRAHQQLGFGDARRMFWSTSCRSASC
jgi:hypothetical protein